MSLKANEQKSPEYAPPGPVRVSDLKPGKKPREPDPDMERMKAAHAARMAVTEAPVSPVGVPDPEARVLLPSPEAIFDVARTGRVSASAPNAASAPRAETPIEAIAEAAKLTTDNVRGLIVQECRGTEALLLSKQEGYGNSALDPVRCFSKASPITGILVRIDDKLSRISRGDLAAVPDEKLPQTVDDLIGYLTLLKVAWRLKLT